MRRSSATFCLEAVGTELGEVRIDLAADVSLRDVIAKTGIRQVWKTNRSSLDLAEQACNRALASAGIAAEDIGLVIVVTESNDNVLPPLAALLHNRLQLPHAIPAFDINQGCSGFVQALCTAVELVAQFGQVLLVCVDRYRSKLEQTDRSTQVVFSDASSAVILSQRPVQRILAQSHLTDGSGAKCLIQPNDSTGHSGYLSMDGSKVFLFTIQQVVPQILGVIEDAEISPDDINAFYLHQASKLVLDGISKRLPKDARILNEIADLGNTVSSTIPFLLESRLNEFRGSLNLMSGFGVGLSASTAVITPI